MEKELTKLYAKLKKLAKQYPDYLIFAFNKETTVEELWSNK